MSKHHKKTNASPKVINLSAALGFGLLGGIGGAYMFGNRLAASSEATEEALLEEELPSFDFSQPPAVASIETSNMAFLQAWTLAREEVGPAGVFEFAGGLYSTFTEAEWNSLSPEQHQQFWAELPPLEEPQDELIIEVPSSNDEIEEQEEAIPEPVVDVIIYDEALVALNVNDSMSFSEAFATAREEVGAGGVFLWNDQMYGTYYETESASMTAADRVDWTASLPSLTVLEHYVAEHQQNEIIPAGGEEEVIPEDPTGGLSEEGEDTFDEEEDIPSGYEPTPTSFGEDASINDDINDLSM